MNKSAPAWRASVLFLVLSAVGCQPTGDPIQDQVEAAIRAVTREVVPDRRLDLFEVQVQAGLELRGVTTMPEAKEILLRKLDSLGLDGGIGDGITVLPDPGLGDTTWALVNVSVSNLRTRPGHSQELTSQVLMGMPLRILSREGSWYRVRGPDRYIAWVDGGAIWPLDREGLDRWNDSSRMMYLRDFGLLRESPGSGEVVSDLSLGGIVRAEERSGGLIRATLPDGRTGWLPADDLEPLRELESAGMPSAASLIGLARTFMGRPYLWGGTSAHGVDCSGFIKTVFYRHGIILSRDANQQVLHGEEVPFDGDWRQLHPGDLMFFGRSATEEREERVSHVALFLGDGRFIHSSGRVRVNSLVPSDPVYSQSRRETLLHVRRIRQRDQDAGPWSLTGHPWY